MTWRHYILPIAVLLVLLALSVRLVRAAPPPGTDLTSPEHIWFEGAHTPSCISCCGTSDGHAVLARRDADAPAGWDVMLDGEWTPVPASIRTTQCAGGINDNGHPVGDYRPHPAGRAVIWILDGKPFCWAPPDSAL